MTKKPKGRKYHHLHARNGVVYYERIASGKRLKLSTKTASWEEAASFRDLYEEKYGIGLAGLLPRGEVPTFAEFAKRYCDEDTGDLAPTTRSDRKAQLREGGRILKHLGSYRLDEITPETLHRFWQAEIQGSELTAKTGLVDLDAIAATLGYARDLELIPVDFDPVARFRKQRRKRARTQRGRAEAESKIRPVESPEELVRLVAAAYCVKPLAHLLVLLLLDAGLRLGEALALQWRHVQWGAGPDDRRRLLRIEGSRSRGATEIGATKSGRARSVALSKRLRRALLAEYVRAGRPEPEAFVLAAVRADNFRKREWRRILERVKLVEITMKDLRDTYASHLLTAGVQLGYVSRQLGHSDVAVTARHYAKWCGGDEYRDPVRLGAGELPADVLAKVAESHQSPTTSGAEALDSVHAAGESLAVGVA